MSMQTQSVFSNRSFTLFYAGQSFSYVGDGLRLIAIPLLVYHLTGSALSIGITYALELGPFALFGVVGGSLADRLDRRRLMIACDALRFCVLAFFAAGYALGFLKLWMLYTGIVVISLAAATFLGAQSSTIPYLLGKERATRAISALLVAEQTAQMVLPPIGGALFALIGPLPALAINAGTYLCSQLFVASAHDFGPEKPGGLPSPRAVLSDIAIGFRFAWRDKTIRLLSFVSLFFNFFGFMTAAAFIPFLKRDLGASDVAVGYALGIGALGALAGSFVGGRLPPSWPFGRIITVAYLVDGLIFAPVMFTHNLSVAIFFLALSNGCVLIEVAQIVGWRTRVTPEEMIGRVSGAVRLVVLIGTVPGAILGGVLADRFGARLPIIVSGAGYILVALLIAALPQIRRERR